MPTNLKRFNFFIAISLLFVAGAIIFLASACGGGSSTPPAATVSLSADASSVLVSNASNLTWSSTNATACSASWTAQTSTSGSEAVTISTAGNNTYAITCTGSGAVGSASVIIEGYRNTDGVVVDGYISGAEVCIDENNSWTCDSNENTTTSDNDGKFTIKYANGNLVSIGGTDLDSQTPLDNLLITHKLTGHSDFKAITPVTSLAAFMTDAANINTSLGIDSTIDVFTFDPVANKGDGGINDYLYEKGNQLTVLAYALQNITNDLNVTTDTTQDYFKAITEEIEKEYTETSAKVDIETEAFIAKALNNVVAAKTLTITDEAKANSTKALSFVMPVIQVKSSNDLTASVIRFAVSTLQTDIKAIANGTASAETITSYTADILTYIATDQNLDSGDLAPNISAITDSVTTSEDASVSVNVLSNDSYVTSAPISVTAATNGVSGTTSVSNNLITYTPTADFNGTDTFTYTITQGDKTSTANVTVTIEAVNDAPVLSSTGSLDVVEGNSIVSISASDVENDSLTFTLTGSDAASFAISATGELSFVTNTSFASPADIDTNNVYDITIAVSDGVLTTTKDFSITVVRKNTAPEFTSGSTFSAEENQNLAANINAYDDNGDSISYSLEGADSASFNINSKSGVLTFIEAPDYETKNRYLLTILVSDSVNSSSLDITINISNIEESAFSDCKFGSCKFGT